MKFYTSIADLYDEIFPYKPQQKEFVKSFEIKKYETSLLDVGCGTGSLTLNLADVYKTVIGIDPDKEMLERANIKALKFKFDHHSELENLGHWVFMQKGMLDLTTEYAPVSFDTIICFGNTLVHLSTREDVKEFLKQTYEVLKPDGYLMIQIINYDRILDQELNSLPSLESDNMKFDRVYNYESNPEFVNFETTLTVKESGDVIENSIPLLAIRPQELRGMIAEAGFGDVLEFGNFKKGEFSQDSQPFILVAQK